MRAHRHQFGDCLARIPTGHQSLADEHRVGARARVREQIGRAANTRLGDLEHVAGQARRDAREGRLVDLEGLEVASVDPDDGGTGLEGAILNVRINLPSVQEGPFKKATITELAELQKKAAGPLERTQKAVEAALE